MHPCMPAPAHTCSCLGVSLCGKGIRPRAVVCKASGLPASSGPLQHHAGVNTQPFTHAEPSGLDSQPQQVTSPTAQHVPSKRRAGNWLSSSRPPNQHANKQQNQQQQQEQQQRREPAGSAINAVPSNTSASARASAPAPSQKEQRWTAYLEQMHRASSLQEVLQLASQAWPAATSQQQQQQQGPGPGRSSNGSTSGLTPAVQGSKQAVRGHSKQATANTPASLPGATGNRGVSGQPTSTSAAAVEAGSSGLVLWRDVDPALRSEAAAAVDTLELIGSWLSAYAAGNAPTSKKRQGQQSQKRQKQQKGTKQQQTESNATAGPQEGGWQTQAQASHLNLMDEQGSGTSRVADDEGYDSDSHSRVGNGAQHAVHRTAATLEALPYDTLLQCQVVVQQVLKALIPLLPQSTLRPKNLASLARAVNTLASASPATNTRQVMPAGQQGYLQPAGQQASQQSMKAVTGSAEMTGPSSSGPALYVLANLPEGWAAAYAKAVQAALPHCSAAALCYLLRAVSLDRCKRLLRAAKWLTGPLTSSVAELASSMRSEQVAVALSCAAQLAWDTQQNTAWLQALLQRLVECSSSQPRGVLPAVEAASIFHALGSLRVQPPADVATLLFTSLAAALPSSAVPVPAVNATQQQRQQQQQDRQHLNALQLSSVVWAAARVAVTPPELWLVAYMEATYTLLKEGKFTGTQLSQMLWGLAKIGWGPSKRWLAACFGALSPVLPHVRPAELALMAWAFSNIKFRPGLPLLHQLAVHAERCAPHLDARQLSMLWLAWARINYKPNAQVAKALFTRMKELIVASFGSPPSLQGQQKPALHPSTASAGAIKPASDSQQPRTRQKRQPKGLATGPQGSRTPGPEFSPQSVANLCWAIQQAGLLVYHPDLVAHLAHAAQAVMPQLKLLELGMVATALGSVRVQVVGWKAPPGLTETIKDSSTAQPTSPMAATKQPPPSSADPAEPVLSASAAVAKEWRDPLVIVTAVNQPFLDAYLQASKVLLQRTYIPNTVRPAGVAADQRFKTVPESDNKAAAGPSDKGKDDIKTSSRSVAVVGPWGPAVPISAQCSNTLLGAVMLGNRAQPPADWMDVFYKVSELEVLLIALIRMKPPPRPPLPWVKVFADRRDQLSVQTSTPKHVKKQMLLALNIMQREWQAHIAEQQQQQQQQQQQEAPDHQQGGQVQQQASQQQHGRRQQQQQQQPTQPRIYQKQKARLKQQQQHWMPQQHPTAAHAE